VIPAMAIDLDAAGVGTDAYAFCDPAWRAGIAALPADTALGAERRERLRILPVEQRYDTLLEAGLLGGDFGALAQGVARRRPAAAWARLGRVVLAVHGGFWIATSAGTPGRARTADGPLSADSLARLIRRLGR